MDKVTNYIKFESNDRLKMSPEGDFFPVWVSILQSLHNLTKKEMEVFSVFLKRRYLLSKRNLDMDMVERDLLTYVEAFDAKLYHSQDYKNNEIDAIIELQDGSWCGVEIKLGANQIEEAANNLVKINNEIIQEGGKAARSLCVICGLTNAAYRRNDNVYVVPITSLKD